MTLPSSSFISNAADTLDCEFWRSRYCFLLSRGYALPISLAPAANEKGSYNPLAKLDLVNATRAADGLPVCIRWMSSRAASAHMYAAARARRPWDHVCNHIAPVLDVVSSEDSDLDATHLYIVMPRLVEPGVHIKTVTDVAECVEQILTALVTLHEDPLGMTLGGCSLNDFGVYCEPDLEGQVNIRYCITNFTRAVRFGDESGPGLDIDRRAAYAADIVAFGSILKTELVERYTNLSFLEPLIAETKCTFYIPAGTLCNSWRQRCRRRMAHILTPRLHIRRLRSRDETLLLRHVLDTRDVVILLTWRDPRLSLLAICVYYLCQAMGFAMIPSTGVYVDFLATLWGLASVGSWWILRLD